jgi:hypothetical protein
LNVGMRGGDLRGAGSDGTTFLSTLLMLPVAIGDRDWLAVGECLGQIVQLSLIPFQLKVEIGDLLIAVSLFLWIVTHSTFDFVFLY